MTDHDDSSPWQAHPDSSEGDAHHEGGWAPEGGHDQGGYRYDQGGYQYDQAGQQYDQGGQQYDQGGYRYDQAGQHYDQGGYRYDQAGQQYDQGGYQYDQAGQHYDQGAYAGQQEQAPGQWGNLGYAVDIVFVIDITGSMTPVIEQVKAGALSFHQQLMATMQEKDKYVTNLRLRVVAYRDYYDNPADALFHTPFFNLPDDAEHFHGYVSALYADGGGDEPESGLEALGVAMASDWERGLDRRRHVVVLFSDASAHPLEAAHGRAVPGYPTHIPSTFDDLTDQWDDPQGQVMEYAAKRLLIYAPDVYPWNVISSNWDNVLHYPSRAGQGLNELEFGQIIDAIAGSV